MLSLGKREASTSDKTSSSQFELAGSLTRQTSAESPLATTASDAGSSHIRNIGKLIEDVEGKIRSQVVEIYFGKTKDVLGLVRSKESLEGMKNEQNLRRELMGMWKK
jgi:capping protein (actin filament) muscle Z-line, beta